MAEEKKRGPGRPKGAKNKNPSKATTLINNKVTEVVSDSTAVEKANKEFEKQLSGDIKRLYKLYSKTHRLPIEDLKELAHNMHVRYKIALQTELEEYEQTIKTAKKEKQMLTETRKINGKYAKPEAIEKKHMKLDTIISSKYKVSSTLTTLTSELRTMYVEIERIESGRDTRDVNIFNILNGKEDPEMTRKLKEELFTPTDDLYDPEDAEWQDEEK